MCFSKACYPREVRKTFLEVPHTHRPHPFRVVTAIISFVVALTLAFAMAVQLMSLPNLGVVVQGQFFSHFANSVSVFAVLAMIAGGIIGLRTSRDGRLLAIVRANLALYAIMILVPQIILLAQTPLGSSPGGALGGWSAAIIYFLVPAFLVVEWVFNPLRARIPRWSPFVGLALALVWLAAAIVLGEIFGWDTSFYFDSPTDASYPFAGAYIGALVASHFVAVFFVLIVNRIHYRIIPRNLFES